MKKLFALLLIAFPVIAQQEANRFTIIPNTNGSAQGALLFQGITRSLQANIDTPAPGVVEFGDGTVGHNNAQLKIGSLLSSGAISGLSFSGAGTGLTGTAASLNIGGSAAQLNGQPASYYLNTGTSAQSVGGSFTASSFIGSGTGLTGTAAGLSIGGSAAQLNGQPASYYINTGTSPQTIGGSLTVSGTHTIGANLSVGGTASFASTLGVAGNATVAGSLSVGSLSVSGGFSAASFSGAGTGLTGTAASLSIGGSAAQLNGQPASYYLNTGASAQAVGGSFTASSFIGSGTGLTGTAAGLSIGGNAATATALSATPVGCLSGQYASSIAATGNLGCGQVSYAQLGGTVPTWNQDTTGNAATATSATQLNGQPASYYLNTGTSAQSVGGNLTVGGNLAVTGTFSATSLNATSLNSHPASYYINTGTSAQTIGGNLTAASFTGAGTGLTGTAAGLSIGGSATQLNGQPASYYLDTGSSAQSVGGSFTASSFIGSGAGLTGTATALNIGGNAATATTATQLNGQPASYYLNTGTSAQSVGGSFSATSFIGAGTGLTGTAAGLSIGGTAAIATNAVNLNSHPDTYFLNTGSTAQATGGNLTVGGNLSVTGTFTATSLNATSLNSQPASYYVNTGSTAQTIAGSLTFGGASVVNESGNTNYGWSLTLQQPSSSGTDGPGLGWSKALASGSTQYWRWGIDHGTNIGSISLSEGINFGTDRITVAPGGAVTVAGTLASADGLASVLQWSGCDRTGASDSTSCFNAALSATAGKGLRIPSGTYLVGQLNIPSNIRVVGDGPASKLVRNASIASGYGWLDVANQSNVKLENFMLEGQVTSSTGFDRASLTTPVTSTFTANTSIWIHGGTNIDLNRLLIQHTGGYSVFIDARSANVENVRITENTLQDNRPFLFGSGSDLTYGSWLGGIFYASDGANYSIQNLSITDNTLKRVSGNGIWGWAASTSLLNSGITISRNHFQYMGLDGIEPGPVEALTVHDNTAQYIGFVSTSDGAPGSPKWFNGFTSVPAVAFDSSGLMRNVSFVGNVAIWVNGGCFDLDGASYGVYANNRCYNPQWFDSGYNSTTASQMGPNGLGGQNYMYGMNTGNTNQTSQGASDLEITGNSIYGFGGGSYRLYAARNVHLVGNKAVAVDNSNSTTAHNFYLPITLGNTGTGAYQRAQNNTVTKNKITYPTYSGQSGIFAVGEDSQYGAFQSGDTNTVYDNDLVGALGVFTKDINSSTVSFGMGLISGSGLSTSTYSWCNALSGSTAINCITSQAQTSSGHTSLNFYNGSTWLASIADTGAITATTASLTGGISAPVMTIGSGSSSIAGSLGVGGALSADSLSLGASSSLGVGTGGISTSGNMSVTGTLGVAGVVSDSNTSAAAITTPYGGMAPYRLVGVVTQQAANDSLYVGQSSQVNFFMDRDYSGTQEGQIIWGYRTPKAPVGGNIFTIYNNSSDQQTLFQATSRGTSSGSNYLTFVPGAAGMVGIGAIPVSNTLEVTGTASVSSTLTIGGGIVANGGMTTCSGCSISVGSGSSSVAGSLGIGGALSANSLSVTNGIGANIITIGSGASSITGSLGVGGALSSNSLTVTNGIGANAISIGGGASSISGSLGVGGALSAASLSLGSSSSLGVGTGGISTTGSMSASGTITASNYLSSVNGVYVNGAQTENSSRQFVGAGVYTPSYGITGGSFSLPSFTIIDGSGNFSSTGYVNASNFKSNGSAGVTKTLTGTFTCGGVTVGNIVFNNGILINCY